MAENKKTAEKKEHSEKEKKEIIKEKIETKKEIEKPVEKARESKQKEKIEVKADEKVERIVEKAQEQKGKIVLEREYIIPLRKQLLKAPRYKRAKKAIRTIREFLAKHMKVENRDLRDVKIDKYLNEEIWHRGIKKPASKIKVIAKKDDSGVVTAYLAEIPEVMKFKIAREEKAKKAMEKAGKEEKKEEIKPEKEETAEHKKDTEEKEKASAEAGLKLQEKQAKAEKHLAKQTPSASQMVHRKAMDRH